MVRHGGQRQSAWLDLPDTVTGYSSTCSYSTWNRTSTPPMSRQMVQRTAWRLPGALLTRSQEEQVSRSGLLPGIGSPHRKQGNGSEGVASTASQKTPQVDG